MLEKNWNRSGQTLVDLYARMLLQMDVVQHAALPEGPKILAANHPTTSDPFLLLTVAPGPMSLLITEMCFKVPVLGRYLRLAGHIPVVDGNGRAAFEEARQRLEAGQTVGIFPEGTLSPLAGGLHELRTGAARLALSTGAPVIPVGIHLQRERIRFTEATVGDKTETARWYVRGPYAMTVGEPLYFRGDLQDRARVLAVTAQIRQRIHDLAQGSATRLQAREQQSSGWSQVWRTAGLYASTVTMGLLFGNEAWFYLQQGRMFWQWLGQLPGLIGEKLRTAQRDDRAGLAGEASAGNR